MKIRPTHIALLGVVWITIGAGLLYGFGPPMFSLGIMMLAWAYFWLISE